MVVPLSLSIQHCFAIRTVCHALPPTVLSNMVAGLPGKDGGAFPFCDGLGFGLPASESSALFTSGAALVRISRLM